MPFMLVKDSCALPVEPKDFQKHPYLFLFMRLKENLTNKIIHKVGLVVAVAALNKIEKKPIPPGDSNGNALYRLVYDLLVFRPFVGQILEGYIVDSNVEGLTVSLLFFDGVKVPKMWLREPVVYDETEGVWMWNYEGHMLAYEKNRRVRLKVLDVSFADYDRTDGHLVSANSEKGNSRSAPMIVYARANEDGLGVVEWWD